MSYHSLSSLQKRQAEYLYQAYGKATREAILARYKDVSQTALKQGKLVVSVSDLIQSLEEAIASGNKEQGEVYRQEIEDLLSTIQEKAMKDHLQEWYQGIVGN